jgi:hypothetical protein
MLIFTFHLSCKGNSFTTQGYLVILYADRMHNTCKWPKEYNDKLEYMVVIKFTNKPFGNQNITINFSWPKTKFIFGARAEEAVSIFPALTIFLMCHTCNVEKYKSNKC